MLNIPEEIKTLYRKNNIIKQTRRNIKLRFFEEKISFLFPEDILFPSDELFPIDMEPILIIGNEQISKESLLITESLCESEDLNFGECNASKFEIIVADVTMDITDREFLATIEIGDYELALGIYRVESFIRQADRRMRKITAYDRIRYFHVDVADWYKKVSFPISLKQFRNSLCEYIGIEQNQTELPLDDMMITKTIAPSQLIGLDVIKAICEINGRFGQMDKTGRFKYVKLAMTGIFPAETLFPADDVFPSELQDAETLSYYKKSDTVYEDYIVPPIDGVRVRQEEGDIGASYGTGDNAYIIEGNFLVYGKGADDLLKIAATIYDEISNRIYRPAKIPGPALPWVEVGDGIICYTSNDVIETYCMKRTLKGIQAMTDTYEATGNESREEKTGIQTQIIQIEGKTAVIKKSVDEVSVRVTDLKKYTEAQFKITAEEITAEVRRAKEAESSLSIKADKIAMSVTDLKDDTNSRFEQTASQIALKVSKGEVSSQLSVESDKITLSGNRLIVNSTNFNLDGNGNATFSGDIRGADIYGSNVSGGYIEGTVIDVGPLYADDDQVQIGDFFVSTDGTNSFSSGDGSVELSSRANSGVPYLILEDRSDRTYIGSDGIETDSVISCYALRADDDVKIKNGWTKYWSCSEMFDELYDSVSDRRLKNSIHYLDDSKALDALLKVTPCLFKYNQPVNPHRTEDDWQIGVIAQDAQEPLKRYPIITKAQDGYYRVNYDGFIPLLISSVKELYEEIQHMKGGVWE